VARVEPFDLGLIAKRYNEELCPYLFGNEVENDYWFQSWLEDIRNERNRPLIETE
jgi:hypothetical protein